MSKFTAEERVQTVLRYLKGNESYNDIQKDLNIAISIISAWVQLYEEQGVEAFFKPYTNYPVHFKLEVLNYMNDMGTSSVETAAIFNISSPGMIRNWRKAFENGGIDALQPKKKGRPSMKKETRSNAKKTSPSEGSMEALRAENERLRMENAYLKKLNALVHEQEKLLTRSKRK